LTQPTSIFLEGSIREVVEEILANRGFVMPGDHRALREEVQALQVKLDQQSERAAEMSTLTTEVSALDAELVALKKKLSMAMGAIQAATAQLAGLKTTVDQNIQRTTSASATAEAASDGLTGLEDAFAALIERMGTQTQAPSLPDFALLDGSIAALKKGLAEGTLDAHLPALLAAEQAGQARVGAISAIKQRM
jgi:chromosome segregation ATPase